MDSFLLICVWADWDLLTAKKNLASGMEVGLRCDLISSLYGEGVEGGEGRREERLGDLRDVCDV